jgi:hypothetical protein
LRRFSPTWQLEAQKFLRIQPKVEGRRKGHVRPKARLPHRVERGLPTSLQTLEMAMDLAPRFPLPHGVSPSPWRWSILLFPQFLFLYLRVDREETRALSRVNRSNSHRPLLQANNNPKKSLTAMPLQVNGEGADPKDQGTRAGRKVHKDRMQG